MSTDGQRISYASGDPTAIRISPIAEQILIYIFLAAAIGFSIPPIVNQVRKMRQGVDGTKDYPLWYDTGNRERHGISPYYRDQHDEFPFMYPPGAAGLLAPLSIFGRMPLVIFLVLLNSVAWATCILAPIYLVAGRIRGVPHVLYWMPSLACCVFIWDTYLEGQLAFCLSACVLGMLVCLRKKKPVSAGFLLALAAGFKAFPILALPYLIYRRHWKATAWTFIFLLIFLLMLPACFRGRRGAMDDLKTWTHGILSPNTPERMSATARAQRSYTWQNGSIKAVVHRWLRDVDADTDDNLPKLRVNFASLPFKTVNHVADGLTLLICGCYLLVMPRDNNRTRFTDTAEGAMLLILIILVSPMSFNYNNAWLMCGIAVVLYFITSRSNRSSQIAIAWLLLALLPLVFGLRQKDPNWRYLRALGNTFFTDLILLCELGWLILRSAAVPRVEIALSEISPSGLDAPS